MPKIKICGITDYLDAKNALDLGVDALGFNFYEKSPRFIDPLDAKILLAKLPKTFWRVGVFVNPSTEFLTEVASTVALDTLQFSGEEDREFLSSWQNWRLLKAVRCGGDVSREEVDSFAEVADFLLFDRFDPSFFGGTGIEIDEEALSKLSASGLLSRAFLAGGITPQNVAEKLIKYRPYGIDLASGVEDSPGRKSKSKMKALVEAVSGVESS